MPYRFIGIPTHHWDKTGDTEVARKHRNSTLESRTSRLKLAVRRKPYSGPSLARGVALLYRRNKTNGSWVLRAGDGHGAYWTKAIAEADGPRREQRQDDSEFLRGAGRREKAGARRRRQRRHRTHHSR